MFHEGQDPRRCGHPRALGSLPEARPVRRRREGVLSRVRGEANCHLSRARIIAASISVASIVSPRLKRFWRLNGRLRLTTGSNLRAKSTSPGPANFSTMRKIPTTDLPIRRSGVPVQRVSAKHVTAIYRLSKWIARHDVRARHDVCQMGRESLREFQGPLPGPKPLRALEHLSKAVLFQCKDCGDCSLPDIAFSAPNRNARRTSATGRAAARAKAAAKWMATAIASGCAPTNG